jgi:hypothetical protein
LSFGRTWQSSTKAMLLWLDVGRFLTPSPPAETPATPAAGYPG